MIYSSIKTGFRLTTEEKAAFAEALMKHVIDGKIVPTIRLNNHSDKLIKLDYKDFITTVFDDVIPDHKIIKLNEKSFEKQEKYKPAKFHTTQTRFTTKTDLFTLAFTEQRQSKSSDYMQRKLCLSNTLRDYATSHGYDSVMITVEEDIQTDKQQIVIKFVKRSSLSLPDDLHILQNIKNVSQKKETSAQYGAVAFLKQLDKQPPFNTRYRVNQIASDTFTCSLDEIVA